jgi:hypothetical protein
MLRRVRVTKDGAGFLLRIIDGELESSERIQPSTGDGNRFKEHLPELLRFAESKR